ncbi:MAG: hypothetical protein JJ896_16910 [Rhodothermales bacterium]|nr:hypothetical protein [Rhodothermales bacterium]MBO6781340.1 hypothetical protein [Rhodothermales bacterium]
MRLRTFIISAVVAAAFLAACDTGFEGERFDPRTPDTELAVRDTSLVDNLAGNIRLTSTVLVSWSGTDPDGFVSGFEVRFFGTTEPATGEWTFTTSNDSLVLLPIPRGERIADVVFEVRAIDNEGLVDPTPARTVFPIQNSPPTIRLGQFELPPDTTFPLVSFSWRADDPEGLANLSRIEISLNDSTTYVPLEPDVDFVTLVGPTDVSGGLATDAEVFTGRGFFRSGQTVPGMRLNEENTFYLRAVDQTDTTSVIERYTWYVKAQTSDVLFVNDYRKSTNPRMATYHLGVLQDYLPAGREVDVWDLTRPFTTGSAGGTPRSESLPALADPTLAQTLARWNYIYWLSTSTTDRISTNNLPFAAASMDTFFDNGGKLMVHSPVSLPIESDEAEVNPAIFLMPITELITFPDSLRPSLRLAFNAPLTPTGTLPGVSEPMPPLKSSGFQINTLPYVATGANVIPLYDARYRYVTRQGSRQGTWTGPSTVASISGDRRVGLFAIPLINEQTGADLLVGENGDPTAPVRAVHLMLESLGFPR